MRELRNPHEARTFTQQGLWLQRRRDPTPESVRSILEWAREAAAAGVALPPIGFLADLGHASLEVDDRPRARAPRAIPGVPADLLRRYDDLVLDRLDADWTFARAGDALRRFSGRDRARGLAFALDRFSERVGLRGVSLSPSVLGGLLTAAPEQVLRDGWESLERDGPQPLLIDLYEELIAAMRSMTEALGREDLPELDSGLALEDAGQRLARRQVRRAAQLLEADLPPRRPPRAAPRDTPTRILTDDAYPVGGYNALANRGPIESLLHSQLAYMEPVERPDLFDVKYLRDELLYYSRDENEFLRRRRHIVLALCSDLVATRFKDRELPYQRGVLLLALLFVFVRTLVEWLTAEALAVEIVFVREANAQSPLSDERSLAQSLLADLIANRIVQVNEQTPQELVEHCRVAATRSLCQIVAISVEAPPFRVEGAETLRLTIPGSRPVVDDGLEPGTVSDVAEVESWRHALNQILQWCAR